MQDKQRLLLDMLANGDKTVRELKAANTNGMNITRRAFLVAQSQARAFAEGRANEPWIIMPGLRGTGKTTLMSQLYCDPTFNNCIKIYASFDSVHLIRADINDFVMACRKFIGNSKQPVALFLDEVQYLKDWALGLKVLRDQTERIFIMSTGSSALSLQTNPDVARRSDVIKLHPLCFTEYTMIKQVHTKVPYKEMVLPVPGLAQNIRDGLFKSSDAKECYVALLRKNQDVKEYWSRLGIKIGAGNKLFAEFITYGTLPFTLSLLNEAAIWGRINHILKESLDKDVAMFGKFDSATMDSIQQLLFILASSVEVSMNRLANDLGMDIRTISSVLNALEKTEIVNAIPPKGAHRGNVRKPSKYLFTSPAMRAALCNFGGIITPENSDTLRGKLLEDMVGLYLKRRFFDSPTSPAIVEYDTSPGGADFILSADGTRANSLAIEVGARKKVGRQIIKTLENVGGRYGIIITSGELGIDETHRIVRVPFEYFLLV